MACNKYQRRPNERLFDAFYQAIENYDIKVLVREAANRKILSELERSETERQKNRLSMRKWLINLVLHRGYEAQQEFALLIREFSRHSYKQTCQQLDLAGFESSVAPGKDLSHDSRSAGSTSPMELDTKQVAVVR